MTVLVSVVVPALDRRVTLEHVLPALLCQTIDPASYEILVCDGGSTDGTRDLVDSFGDERVRLVSSGRSGRSAARNAGIAAARGDLLLFNDADIVADARLVEEHVRAHDLHPGSAVVGCEVQVDSLDEYREASLDAACRRHLHRPSRVKLPWWFFLTGNASARRDDVLAAGGFDESFSGYGHEDIELGYRLERAGCGIRYHHAAVSYHWHPQSLAERAAKMRLAGASTIRFYRKHRDWRILARMGVNPVSWAWHGAVRPDGMILRACRARASASHARVSRSILLQHAYLSGVKEALARRVAEGARR